MERIRRVVIRHSGASRFFFLSALPEPECFVFLLHPWADVLIPFDDVFCARFFLGLDGIDHLGLGGGLRRARSVFWFGIYTWHHGRYVSYYFATPPLCGVVLFLFGFL